MTDRPLAGVVLAGGQSRRMGTEKALIEIDGEPLVLRVARRLSTVADPVVLATGTCGRLGALGFEEVPDAVAGAGPLAGLVAGLGASPHQLTAAVAVDLPFVSPPVLALLAARWSGGHAVVPAQGGRLQYLHAVYSHGAAEPLRAALAEGRRKLADVVAELEVEVVTEAEWAEADPAATFAVNLNRPDDLRRMRSDAQPD